MSGGPFNANLYPAAGSQSETAPPRLGLCLSGGGSRALSCALGQLSALRKIEDPRNTKQSVLDGTEWISSVSGGSWAATLFTYLPQKINGQPVSDDDFLITTVDPSKLVLDDPSVNKPGNVAYLAPYCMGNAPGHFNIDEIGKLIYVLYEWGMFYPFVGSALRPWWWIAAVGELIFKPFGLYDDTNAYVSGVTYIQPGYSFSLTTDYVNAKIAHINPGVTLPPFYLVERPNRPALIVNTNILENLDDTNSAQVPVQVMSTQTSVPGQSPDGTIVGGGGVESFAFTSSWAQTGTTSKLAVVTTNRNYSLCDISGCSSAAFATLLLPQLNNFFNTDIVPAIENYLTKEGVEPWKITLAIEIITAGWDEFVDPSAANTIPQYNYWPFGANSQNDNKTYGFSDGGDFDDTGILGLLAQTDVNRIIACINSMEPLAKFEGTILVSEQIGLLFGHRRAPGGWVRIERSDPLSYVQVFSDQNEEFAQLRQGLWNASCGGPTGVLGTYTSAFLQTLTTIENPVANIKAGRKVMVLWMNNFTVMSWQTQIKDPQIHKDLINGQGLNPSGPLENFPLFDTVEQLDLDAEAVNMLAQLSAWNLDQAQVLIRHLLKS